jgi:hypothetical protein
MKKKSKQQQQVESDIQVATIEEIETNKEGFPTEEF